MPPFSVLDLSPIAAGGSPADAFRHTVELAQAAEALGYRRFWLAEHHHLTGVGSAATAVLIGHVAGRTTRIRVGAGGIMLPNHAPLVVAEQFGTLATLYPDRIDLGLGRAPGADPVTAHALRRDPAGAPHRFPADVQELQAYFAPVQPGQRVRAVPGAGLRVPIWLLGSSLFSAELAAALGLPYAFAAHFAPAEMMAALAIYRDRFQPCGHLTRPRVMIAVNVLAAETDAEARHQFTSQQQAFVNLNRGRPGPVPAPIADIASYWSPVERLAVERSLTHSFVGAPATVERGLRVFLAATRPDELRITAHIHDQAARLRSLALVAELRARLEV